MNTKDQLILDGLNATLASAPGATTDMQPPSLTGALRSNQSRIAELCEEFLQIAHKTTLTDDECARLGDLIERLDLTDDDVRQVEILIENKRHSASALNEVEGARQELADARRRYDAAIELHRETAAKLQQVEEAVGHFSSVVSQLESASIKEQNCRYAIEQADSEIISIVSKGVSQ